MKEQTRRELKYLTLIIIFGACLFCSALLLGGSNETTCDTNCAENDYTKTFGINNGLYGIIIFSILFLIAFYLFYKENICPENKKSYKKLKLFINAGIIIGSIIAIYFLYLQQFILKKYCPYCLVIDIGILICLGIITFVRDK